MKLTVIVPAFNEEAYLAPTLGSIRAAADEARGVSGADVEVIVVDNASADGTAAVARRLGATVVHEPVQGIARARNAGARRAAGDVLVFFDADVDGPRTLLVAICAAMRDPACVGGGVDVDHRPRRAFVRLYLRVWRLLGRLTGMVQGAAQFCRRASVYDYDWCDPGAVHLRGKDFRRFNHGLDDELHPPGACDRPRVRTRRRPSRVDEGDALGTVLRNGRRRCADRDGFRNRQGHERRRIARRTPRHRADVDALSLADRRSPPR